MPGLPIKYPTNLCRGFSKSSSGVPICTISPFVHDNHLIGKGQCLHLVVGDIDHRQFQLFVNFLELAPQMPFQVGVDDGERFIEEYGRHVAPHQAAAQRDFLFGVGAQAGCFFIQVRGQIEDLGHFRTRLAVSVLLKPRFFNGKARLSKTVMVSYSTGN
jgi:hypothetical protein